ncbi:MAG: hypothetical protein JJT94_00660 [Bernardetiaceae bacterium]|nr:hypothetical protein [Bernardetiaceae bacterium]
MKKIVLIFALILLITSQSMACDLCGCGVGNYYFGMLPQWQKNFIGLRYRMASYDSHLGMSEVFRTREHFQTVEAMARFYPHKKVQVIAFLPYHINKQETSGKNLYQQGIGDAVILANYEVFSNKNDTTKTLKQEVRLGGGLKLATGSFDFDEGDYSQVANPNFQLGTGSYDFLLNYLHTLRLNDWGVQADVNYKINTSNSRDYRFGNRFSGNLMLFNVQRISSFELMFFGGGYYEHSEKDTERGIANSNTGGYLMAANAGVKAYYKQFSLGFLYQKPLTQNIAQGQVYAHDRMQWQAVFQF